MGIFSQVGSIFGGNAAADAIEKQQRANIKDLSREQGRQEGVIQPFLSAGTRGVNALADFALSAPGTLDPVSQAIEDDVARGITGRFAAMGLNDSGAHTNALARALLPLRMNLRRNRLAELAMPAQFGPGAVNQFMQAGQFATKGRLGARTAIGDARADAAQNMFENLGGIGNNLLGNLSGDFGAALGIGAKTRNVLGGFA